MAPSGFSGTDCALGAMPRRSFTVFAYSASVRRYSGTLRTGLPPPPACDPALPPFPLPPAPACDPALPPFPLPPLAPPPPLLPLAVSPPLPLPLPLSFWVPMGPIDPEPQPKSTSRNAVGQVERTFMLVSRSFTPQGGGDLEDISV